MGSPELKTEYEFYKAIKPKLLEEGREGKFVLIKEKSVIDFFNTEKDAYEGGVKKFGTLPFLIQKVSKEEPVESIQHFHVALH
jgi:hypothetical protein